ncbi:metallophosphoesterase [Enterococcus florum]|uniref:Metallophosphoesterase n=1 Tax=Enterococcus florum TaxID=2480627 RepID=A0A4P5PPS3_9ENTE|nr:metallophosphoesterase [Enterococcus florum]GCF95073.1 metallophosphoesterase [Enterococcus florum]
MLIGLFGILLVIALFNLWRKQTYHLTETHYQLEKDNTVAMTLGKSGRQTIAQISDIHFSRFYSAEAFEQVIAAINQQQPDILLFTGDLVEDFRYWKKRDLQPIIQQLKRLEAKQGKFAVLGNHDYRSNGCSSVREILQKGGFTLLENTSQSVGRFSLTGIEDQRKGDPDYSLTPLQAEYSILMVHEPDQVELVRSLPRYDLVLSGHSHGGQIRLPFFTVKHRGSELYQVGPYRLNSNTVLFVNTGIGTTGPPIRFRVPPEIVYFHFK